MPHSKSNEYHSNLRVVASIARVLLHPARLLLLRQLRDSPATLAQLAVDHPISVQNLNNHLRSLIDADLVQFTRMGRSAIYSTCPKKWPPTVNVLINSTLGSRWKMAS